MLRCGCSGGCGRCWVPPEDLVDDVVPDAFFVEDGRDGLSERVYGAQLGPLRGLRVCGRLRATSALTLPRRPAY